MCKSIKWNPSLRLSILPSIRYFKIERENFRVPRRGVTGKIFFYKLQRLFLSPARYLSLICFFALYYYKQANKWERKHLVKSFIIWGQTSWHCYENAALESLKLARNSAFSNPLNSRSKQYVDRLLPFFLGFLSFSKRALFSTILLQMTFFCKNSPSSSKRSSRSCLCDQSQHNAVTLKHTPWWIAVATGNIHIKTGPGTETRRKKEASHFYSYLWKKLRPI